MDERIGRSFGGAQLVPKSISNFRQLLQNTIRQSYVFPLELFVIQTIEMIT